MKMTKFKVCFDNFMVVEWSAVSWRVAFRRFKWIADNENSHGKIYVLSADGNWHFVRDIGSNTIYFPNGYKVIGSEIWSPNGMLFMRCSCSYEAKHIAESLKPVDIFGDYDYTDYCITMEEYNA